MVTLRFTALVLALGSGALLAQEQPAPSSAPAAATPATPALPGDTGAEATTLKPVEVRASLETEGRRQSTAAKIIFGREEIERYGDSTLGELFKRLPGVTTGGRPGQGGAPRMRGLGSGYTQVLIDGERAPRGFSTDDIAPEQVERIEILRAPTAETGARAIAGTINIVTRGGYTKYLNNATLGAGVEDGRTSPGASWSRNDTVDGVAYNVSVSVAHSERSSDQTKDTQSENLATSALVNQFEATRSSSQRDVLHANARLQWNNAGGDTFTLMPMVVATQGTGTSASVLTQSDGAQAYNSSTGSSDSSFSMLRLAGSWAHKTDSGARWLVNSSLGRSQWHNGALRSYSGGSGLGATDTQSDQHDTTWSNTLKVSQSIADKHSLVSGLELEGNQRNETATTLRSGESALSDFDGNLLASSLRAALYAQDEWEINPHWAAHAGLRWEGIRTSGSVSAGGEEISNDSQVLTPLLHAVWRPNLAVKDQWRASLTRSYRSPNLSKLIARPSINNMYPTGSNTELQPDTAGNPNLLPELAVGLDLAFEHYLPSGGLLSANVFVRQISNVMRSQTALETVSWSDAQRWVARMQNVGSATTQGLELEAKLRLTEWLPEAPPVDVRANLSLMRSSLDGVSGPNNRLDQQPDGTANLGADYRLKGWPLKLSANLNFTPGYTTRLSDDQQVFQSDKLVGDASVIWILSPRAQLRLSASNFSARNYLTGANLLTTNSASQPLREATQTTAPTYTNLQAKLELKL
ncbi:MAG: TonB-dependent receptor [Rhodoferax sp.]|nr:TonB-dependent receptor [Rhodoferax sp.]